VRQGEGIALWKVMAKNGRLVCQKEESYVVSCSVREERESIGQYVKERLYSEKL